MERSIRIHEVTPEPFAEAVVEAYNWVMQEGGVLVFASIELRKRAKSILDGLYGSRKVEADLDTQRIHIGVAWGERYLIYGPRVAMFDCNDNDMKCLESNFDDDYDGPVREIRSFARTVDTHKNWTRDYQPTVIG